MNPETTRDEALPQPDGSTVSPTNGHARAKVGDFAQRAKSVFSEWPPSLRAKMKDAPYTTLGIAFALGLGAGLVFGSRILRAVAVSTATHAVIAMASGYLLRSNAPAAVPRAAG